MLLGVLVPVYNTAPYLEECFDSLRSQTWGDFEVVLVDDGSTDNSGALCDAFAREWPHVRVLHTQNRGPLLARSTAVRESQADYLVFLDSDDCLRPDALELCARALLADPADMLCFDFSRSPSFYPREHASYRMPLDADRYVGADFSLVREAVCLGGFNTMCGKVVRREACLACPDFEEYRGMHFAEDLLQLLHVMEGVHSVCYLHEALYFYRPRSDGSTGSCDEECLANLDCVVPILLEKGRSWGLAGQAAAGAAMQYAHLLKLLFSSNVDAHGRRCAFDAVVASLRSFLGSLFPECRAWLRPDNRLLLDAAMAGRYTACKALLAALRGVKRLGGGHV